jgi:hypothetical protein
LIYGIHGILYSSGFRTLFPVLKQDMAKFYFRTRKGIASKLVIRVAIVDGYATNALASCTLPKFVRKSDHACCLERHAILVLQWLVRWSD